MKWKLLLLLVLCLALASCARDYEVVCCRTLRFEGQDWFKADNCKTVRSDDGSCPDGYYVKEVVSYPEESE